MSTEPRGRVVLLNGPSSAGKSSIGRAMLARLADPWFFVPVDGISGMRSTRHTRVLGPAEIDEMLRRTRLGYHRTVAALASAGNDVIMDYPLSEPWRLEDLLDVLTGYDVTLAHVRCSAAELERRERVRGDRPLGLAASQTQVFAHDDHDIVVDTTHHGAGHCASEIVRRLDGLSRPKAFDRLRARTARPPRAG
ncbi:phosphotransferase-like protein [Amycolatopsis sp. PS_44_ISF1]|uniref:chloramphenicol phosphotransferase CPT family protein n=1 Tax=Amycolatopsis sp. PS_44_ISF1 TaxID=2974917 RepID=UPI0028E00C36|nr:AAA family ATPase [Amycolatopsis sp. PS_44_ISF1]MDT8911958.1 chloramphenicol phosphotransferase CPT family protein [Amycolatopsis sp. PS_44_ISF1]